MVKNNVGKSQAIPYLLMQTIIPMITASIFKNLEEIILKNTDNHSITYQYWHKT